MENTSQDNLRDEELRNENRNNENIDNLIPEGSEMRDNRGNVNDNPNVDHVDFQPETDVRERMGNEPGANEGDQPENVKHQFDPRSNENQNRISYDASVSAGDNFKQNREAEGNQADDPSNRKLRSVGNYDEMHATDENITRLENERALRQHAEDPDSHQGRDMDKSHSG